MYISFIGIVGTVNVDDGRHPAYVCARARVCVRVYICVCVFVGACVRACVPMCVMLISQSIMNPYDKSCN